jgi:hypothetical protein
LWNSNDISNSKEKGLNVRGQKKMRGMIQ